MKFESLVLELLLTIIEFQTSPDTKIDKIAKLYKLREYVAKYRERIGDSYDG